MSVWNIIFNLSDRHFMRSCYKYFEFPKIAYRNVLWDLLFIFCSLTHFFRTLSLIYVTCMYGLLQKWRILIMDKKCVMCGTEYILRWCKNKSNISKMFHIVYSLLNRLHSFKVIRLLSKRYNQNIFHK